MLKIEKKLLVWVEKNVYIITILFAVLISLYLRRLAVWWLCGDVAYYFDGHENNIQSMLYNGMVWLSQYVPMLPIHIFKWLSGLADYVVALLCVLILKRNKNVSKMVCAFWALVCLMSPVVFMRGICWGQVDSVALMFLLGAYLLWDKEKRVFATILAVIGISIYPCYFLILFLWLVYETKGTINKKWIYLGIAVLLSVAIQEVCGFLLGYNVGEGLLSCVRWTTYDLYTGLEFRHPLLWIKQMIVLLGYAASLMSGLAACQNKIKYRSALIVNIMVILVYGSMMFPEESLGW